jgi:hypothetical protein
MKKVEGGGKSPKRIVLILLNLLLIAGLAGFGGYYFWRYRQVMQNPAAYIDLKQYAPTQEEENKKLLESIGKLISLPADETPIISTIKDVESLKKDPFFTNAINGDRLIIYQTAKQAILYRESENKIIKAGPVVLPDATKKKVSIIATEPDAASIEQRIGKAFANDATVLGKTTPAVGHESLVVFDSSGSNAQLAQKIATELGGSVVNAMPEGEEKPSGADIIVIATSQAP